MKVILSKGLLRKRALETNKSAEVGGKSNLDAQNTKVLNKSYKLSSKDNSFGRNTERFQTKQKNSMDQRVNTMAKGISRNEGLKNKSISKWRRKVGRLPVRVGECHITQTRNNMFIVLMNGSKVIMQLSSGKVGAKGIAKRTRLVADRLGRETGSKALKLNYLSVKVYMRGGISPLMRAVVGGLGRSGIKIKELIFKRSIAHNGVRLPKTRRK